MPQSRVSRIKTYCPREVSPLRKTSRSVSAETSFVRGEGLRCSCGILSRTRGGWRPGLGADCGLGFSRPTPPVPAVTGADADFIAFFSRRTSTGERMVLSAGTAGGGVAAPAVAFGRAASIAARRAERCSASCTEVRTRPGAPACGGFGGSLRNGRGGGPPPARGWAGPPSRRSRPSPGRPDWSFFC